MGRKEDPEKEVPEEEEEEEDIVDPLETLKEKCGQNKECAGFASSLQECNDRVNSRKQTEETCSDEIVDYFHCIDHCLGPKLFSHLK